MAMSRNERIAYARGYNSRSVWPLHIPPAPPQAQVAEIMAAGRQMRDWLDGQLAMGAYEESEVGPMLDRFDGAMAKVGEWIRSEVESKGEGL